jgi:hypothetical protein
MQVVVVGQRQAAVAFVGRELGFTVSHALKKGGWRCMRFGQVRKWLSNSKRREVWVLGKEAREVRLTFQMHVRDLTWYNTWACFCVRQGSTSPRALTIHVLFLLSNYISIQDSTMREETFQDWAKNSPFLADEADLSEHDVCIAWL